MDWAENDERHAALTAFSTVPFRFFDDMTQIHHTAHLFGGSAMCSTWWQGTSLANLTDIKQSHLSIKERVDELLADWHPDGSWKKQPFYDQFMLLASRVLMPNFFGWHDRKFPMKIYTTRDLYMNKVQWGETFGICRGHPAHREFLWAMHEHVKSFYGDQPNLPYVDNYREPEAPIPGSGAFE